MILYKILLFRDYYIIMSMVVNLLKSIEISNSTKKSCTGDWFSGVLNEVGM